MVPGLGTTGRAAAMLPDDRPARTSAEVSQRRDGRVKPRSDGRVVAGAPIVVGGEALQLSGVDVRGRGVAGGKPPSGGSTRSGPHGRGHLPDRERLGLPRRVPRSGAKATLRELSAVRARCRGGRLQGQDQLQAARRGRDSARIRTWPPIRAQADVVSILVAIDECTTESGCLWFADGVDELLPTDERGVVRSDVVSSLSWSPVELAPVTLCASPARCPTTARRTRARPHGGSSWRASRRSTERYGRDATTSPPRADGSRQRR